ncbi:helix-turn-helix domain-containing protein [Porphyromonas levii]|uniref:helix-turn-helix domain-containing protein n=2 Tax=Porphyromonas levii TaxID=28114 RepID=UPI001B8AEBF4|nr:helix-turn-helix domain-containing protein [Porphyromonas levii]MBR8766602.1 hypothetical protein [Porphyromonas levii]MBR8770661.1 hypothetical protein [Porphyromonas levii]MBR8785513.1 hypothetical protein [Porphyromonas levii]MBR8803625.1 hypothetical protein [Porphyromonas levii]
MEVIGFESNAFHDLLERIKRIEGFVERSSSLLQEIDEELEMTSKDVMNVLNISKSTLYRWRKSQMIPFRFTGNGDVRYPYKSVCNAIKSNRLTVVGLTSDDALRELNKYKDNIILSCCSTKSITEESDD